MGIAISDLAYTGLDFPGYGEMEGSEREILSACQAALPPGRVVCDCDCAIAWAGSLAMQACNPATRFTSLTFS